MPTHTYGWTWQTSTGASLSGSVSITANAELNFDFTINSASDAIASGALTVANVQGVWITPTQAMTLNINGVNEIQALTPSGTISGGTFTITYSGQTTSALAYNSTAAQIQTAMQALSNTGADTVLCTGGPINTTLVTLTFRKTLGSTNVAQVTVATGSLTGGGTITPSTTTGGVAAGQTISLKANATYEWVNGYSPGACPLTTNWTTGFVAANDSGAPGNLSVRVLYN